MASVGEPSTTTTTQTTTTQFMPPAQHSALAQMTFGPATQQTVTTVTTTTTIELPPLIMQPPRDLYDRDPKLYPLAFSPTPQALKRFAFDLNGRPTVFREVEDAAETFKRLQEVQSRIKTNNGALRHEDSQQCQTPLRESAPGCRATKASSTKRMAGPISSADGAEFAASQRKTKKQRASMSLHPTETEEAEQLSLNQRMAAGAFPNAGNPSPVTPELGTAGSVSPQDISHRQYGRRRTPPPLSQSHLRQLQDTDGAQSSHTKSELDRTRQEPHTRLGAAFHGRGERKRKLLGERTPSSENSNETITATMPASKSDQDLSSQQRHMDYRRPALPNIITNAQLDASLPSPSLSPITAAANLMSRTQTQFGSSYGGHNEESVGLMSGLDLDEGPRRSSNTPLATLGSAQLSTNAEPVITQGPAFPQPLKTPTVMDIPMMIDAFDSMPEAMQSYLLYQFLRRCAKSTLQVVANVVNPALKCDPFNILPPELCLNITRYLDAPSMCRAARVSKKWRKLVNSDERAWKDLLERDEFVLPKDEIARAVREGWGWQHPGEDGCERDLSRQAPGQSLEMTGNNERASSISDDDATSSIVSSRPTRRAMTRTETAKKVRRRAAPTSLTTTPGKLGTSSGNAGASQWRRLLTSAHGPIAFATAAAQAVPHPSIGLPSLRNMHLFKSLYQRHFLIRRAWMMEEAHSQPLHLAFRAHHRHVVTCLLFDSDKILTGSDDTKINVYDTKTGALRNRLEGHEGGVWALQYEGDTLVSGSTDRSVRVWDIKTGQCLQVFQGHTSTVRCLVILQPVQIGKEADGSPIIMPKEPLIITGSRDSTLRVWKLPKPTDPQIFQTGPPANDRDNPYFLRTLAGHHNSVRAIAAHGDTLVSGSYDCSVRVWKISNGDLVHRLQGHTQKVYSVVLDHARARCISGSMDNLVKVWDLLSGTCLFNLEGHTSLVGLLDLSHDRLVSAAADSTLRIWDPETGTCKATLSAHTGAITCFQHDGQKVISGSDRTLKMWNVKNGECVRDLLTDLSGVWQVRFDQRRCVAAVQRNALTYIEVLDFGAARDGVPADRRGRRVVVDVRGREVEDADTAGPALDPEITVGGEI